MNYLSSDDFARMFGGPLDPKTIAEAAQYDWSYVEVDTSTGNRIVLDLLMMADQRKFSVAGQNTERWQKGWQENLDEFRRTGAVAALEPKYLRPAKYLRLGGKFIAPLDPMFERNWYRVFRGWFARRYLAEFDMIYEFGCGSGHNIAFLAQEFPSELILGLDWARSSIEITRALAEKFPNVPIGFRFDFFDPPASEDWAWDPNTAILTVGALEQTGLRWRPFLNFLRRTQPAMCFHIEPILEWYDPGNLVDYTAIKLHEGRGFWRGFVNEITPVWKHRTGFGSLLLEGYSQFAWSPAASEQARIDAREGAP